MLSPTLIDGQSGISMIMPAAFSLKTDEAAICQTLPTLCLQCCALPHSFDWPPRIAIGARICLAARLDVSDIELDLE